MHVVAMYDDFQKLRRGVVNVRFPRAKRLKTKKMSRVCRNLQKVSERFKEVLLPFLRVE